MNWDSPNQHGAQVFRLPSVVSLASASLASSLTTLSLFRCLRSSGRDCPEIWSLHEVAGGPGVWWDCRRMRCDVRSRTTFKTRCAGSMDCCSRRCVRRIRQHMVLPKLTKHIVFAHLTKP
jgi:hypothetical protein